MVLDEAVCVGRTVKRGLTVRRFDWVAAGEVSCAGDTVKEGLTVQDLHSGVLDGVDWVSCTVKEGPGVNPIVADRPCEDSTESSRPAITQFDSVVSVWLSSRLPMGPSTVFWNAAVSIWVTSALLLV